MNHSLPIFGRKKNVPTVRSPSNTKGIFRTGTPSETQLQRQLRIMSICPTQTRSTRGESQYQPMHCAVSERFEPSFLILEIGKVFFFLQILQLWQFTFFSFYTKNKAKMNVLAVRKHRKDNVYSSPAFSGSYVVQLLLC